MTIEQAIQHATGQGTLSLSIFTASTGYQANLSVDGKSWRCEMAADPVTALKKVLGLLPGAAGQMIVEPETGGAFE